MRTKPWAKAELNKRMFSVNSFPLFALRKALLVWEAQETGAAAEHQGHISGNARAVGDWFPSSYLAIELTSEVRASSRGVL